MKKFYLYLFLVSFSVGVFAQSSNCDNPVSNIIFNQQKNRVAAQGTDMHKLNTAKTIVKTYCLSSDQVKQIAELFINDLDRYEFCSIAYNRVFDKDNFYEVFDAFAYFSTAFRLYDYVKAVDSGEIPGKGVVRDNGLIIQKGIKPNVPKINFPNYNYPNHENYTGAKNCNQAVGEDVFDKFAVELDKQKSDATKKMTALKEVRTKCYTVTHYMKMAYLMKDESIRLSFFKSAYSYVYDKDNYASAKQLLSNLGLRKDLMDFIASQSTNSGSGGVSHSGGNNSGSGSSGSGGVSHTPSACQVTAQEYAEAKAAVKKENFNNAKFNIAKQIIKSKECFTAVQLKGIIALMGFEATRLKLAKFAYDYCIDKSNYYKINDVFDFSSSKTELSEYINSKQ